MRFILTMIFGVLMMALGIIVEASTAKGDHIPEGFVSPLSFACESADSMIKLLEAETNTEANAILVGANCYTFRGVTALVKGYVGTHRDPMMNNKEYEVYEVELPDGGIFYTAATVPELLL